MRIIKAVFALCVPLAFAASSGAAVLIDDDFSAGSISANARFRLNQADAGWYKTATSLWDIDGVLTNAGTTAGIPAEGAVGQLVSTAALNLGLDQLTVSFDYTVGTGSTLYFHLIGLTTNGAPAADEQLANTGAQSGSIQNQAETDFGDMNILNGNDPNGSIGGAVAFAATSGTYTATFDLSDYSWSADESPGLTGAVHAVTDFDFVQAVFASNVTTNDGAGAISIDNFNISLEAGGDAELVVTPDALSMVLLDGEAAVTGSVDVAYISATNMNIAVSISDESHAGSFSLLSATPQVLTSATALEFEYDNAVHSLSNGVSATGLVTIAWNEVGSTTTNEVIVPISAQTGFAAGANNSFNGAGDGIHWGDADNWALDRVPGALGKDNALVQSGAIATVATNFFAPFSWDLTVRSLGTLNIAADLLNGGPVKVGHNAGHVGFVNQTAGAVEATSVTVGEGAGTAPSNSVYSLTGGSITASTGGSLHSTGVLDINGGTLTHDTFGNNDITVFGAGLLKLQ